MKKRRRIGFYFGLEAIPSIDVGYYACPTHPRQQLLDRSIDYQVFFDAVRSPLYRDLVGPSGARNVMVSIRDAVRLLREQPYSGYGTDDPEVRVKFVIRYPYKIFYRAREDFVEIAHIRHTLRRPWQGER